KGYRGELASRDVQLSRRLCQSGRREGAPSTAITCPGMKPARAEHRNATAAATSSAVPSRLIGVSFTSSPTISSVNEPVVSSVRTYPGATALHVMLREPYSRATDLVNPISPALAAA